MARRKIYQAGARLKESCPICQMRIEKGHFWQRDKGTKVHRECFKNKDTILSKMKKLERQKQEAKKRIKENLQSGECAYCGKELRKLEDIFCMRHGKGFVCKNKKCIESSLR